jgi:hypothetical protein
MPTLIMPLDAGRAMVAAEISVPDSVRAALVASGATIPDPIVCRAIVDTGAGITCIDPRIRHGLGLVVMGNLAVASPFGPPEGQPTDLFEVVFRIRHSDGNAENNLVKPLWSVAEAPVAHTGAEVLIGTDMLEGSRFIYDGVALTFTWEY